MLGLARPSVLEYVFPLNHVILQAPDVMMANGCDIWVLNYIWHQREIGYLDLCSNTRD